MHLDMKTIDSWRDQEEFGIFALTLARRATSTCGCLCDLNRHGALLVRELFGMPFHSTFAKPWNSGARKSIRTSPRRDAAQGVLNPLAVLCLVLKPRIHGRSSPMAATTFMPDHGGQRHGPPTRTSRFRELEDWIREMRRFTENRLRTISDRRFKSGQPARDRQCPRDDRRIPTDEGGG